MSQPSIRPRILVTGGAGYIGSHTVQKLLSAGFDPVVYDNLSTGFKESVPDDVPFVYGDILDENLLLETLQKYQISLVVHFAAKLVVPESVQDPILYYQNNTAGVMCLVRAMQKAKVSRLVFSSTAAVYGNQESNAPLDESISPRPESPYGWSKLFSERIIQDAESAYGLKAIILRYFNVAGASVDSSNGQRTKNATHLIKVASEVAAGKSKSVQVFGNDYPTVDGTGVRDYIHVEDLAHAHVLSTQKLLGLEAFLKNPLQKTTIFNCGYGRGFSVLQVIEAMEKASGKVIKKEFSSRRTGDPVHVVASNEKIKAELGWVPKNDDLKLICKSSFDWEKKLSSEL